MEISTENEYNLNIRLIKDTQIPVLISYGGIRGMRVKATSNTRSLNLNELDEIYYSQVYKAKLNRKIIQEQDIYSRLKKVRDTNTDMLTREKIIRIFDDWTVQTYTSNAFSIILTRPYIP